MLSAANSLAQEESSIRLPVVTVTDTNPPVASCVKINPSVQINSLNGQRGAVQHYTDLCALTVAA